MSPTHKEYVFDLADLKFIGVVCGQCQGEVIIDASDSTATIPLVCSICAKAFERPVAAPANLLLQAYQSFKNPVGGETAAGRIRIRVAK
jgi:hypothetical protein